MISWAIQRKGPTQKQYFETPNRQEGFVCHSVEGSLAGAFRELDNESRPASWHFTLDLDGTLYQHYALQASCWASGNFEANTRYVAMEAVGTQAAPLTSAQEVSALRLWRELGFTSRGVNLFEHNEVATIATPNAGSTECPSHRYDGAFSQLEENMTPEDRAKLDAVYAALTGGVAGVIESWNANGNSMIVAYNDLVFPHVNNPTAHPHKHAGILATGEPKELQA